MTNTGITKRSVFITVLLLNLVSALAMHGQNTDFASLAGIQFNFGNPGARSLGMGGAFLGLADDATAAEANPAGLTILTKPELSIEGRNFRIERDIAVGGTFPDELQFQEFSAFSRRAELSYASLVYPIRNASIAVYYHEALNYNINSEISGGDPLTFYFDEDRGLVNESQCDAAPETCSGFVFLPTSNSVRLYMKTAGVAGAWKFGTLSLGAAVKHQRLDMLASNALFDFDGQFSGALIQQSDKESDITWSAGVKWSVRPNLSVGAVYKQGSEIETEAVFVDDTGEQALVGLPMFHVPDVAGVGISFRPAAAWTINIDAVHVKYSNLVDDVQPFFGDADPRQFEAEDVIETHVGAEYFFSTQIPIALRAGWWRDPAHQTIYRGAANTLGAAAEVIQFSDEGRDINHYSIGVGIVFRNFQIDAAYDTSDPIRVGSLSGVWRF